LEGEENPEQGGRVNKTAAKATRRNAIKAPLRIQKPFKNLLAKFSHALADNKNRSELQKNEKKSRAPH